MTIRIEGTPTGYWAYPAPRPDEPVGSALYWITTSSAVDAGPLFLVMDPFQAATGAARKFIRVENPAYPDPATKAEFRRIAEEYFAANEAAIQAHAAANRAR